MKYKSKVYTKQWDFFCQKGKVISLMILKKEYLKNMTQLKL